MARVTHPDWLNYPLHHYWRADEEGHADCGIFYESRPGHAYALARAPKYITHEEWDEIAEVFVQAPRMLKLVKQLAEMYEHTDSPLGIEAESILDAIGVKA